MKGLAIGAIRQLSVQNFVSYVVILCNSPNYGMIPHMAGRKTTKNPAAMTPIMLRFPQQLLEDIDVIVAQQPDRPERSTVIRTLIREALEARAKKEKRR